MMRWILINFLLMLAPMVWGQDAVAIAKDIGEVEWTKVDIQAVFLGERSTWPNGRSVLVVLPSSKSCLLYTSPSPRDQRGSRMPSSA